MYCAQQRKEDACLLLPLRLLAPLCNVLQPTPISTVHKMGKLKGSELLEKKSSELKQQLTELKQELTQVRLRSAVGFLHAWSDRQVHATRLTSARSVLYIIHTSVQLRVAQVTAGAASKLAKIKQVRKNIARVLTAVNTKAKAGFRKEVAGLKANRIPKQLRAKKTRSLRRALSKEDVSWAKAISSIIQLIASLENP